MVQLQLRQRHFSLAMRCLCLFLRLPSYSCLSLDAFGSSLPAMLASVSPCLPMLPSRLPSPASGRTTGASRSSNLHTAG